MVFALDDKNIDKLPTFGEIKEVIFSLCRDKASGPNRFSDAFFFHCWEIISYDVVQAVRDLFAGIQLSKSFASTSIFLIPKVPNLSTFTDFDPLSLCNFSHKIISKVLALRLGSPSPFPLFFRASPLFLRIGVSLLTSSQL